MSGTWAWYRSWPVDLFVRLLHYTGLLCLVGLCRKRWGRRRLLILLYHRLVVPGQNSAICGLELDHPVSVAQFESHMRLLRWFGEPLPLDQAYRRLHQSDAGAKTLIAVTFDDGYRDNYEWGRPIWTRYRIPITLFPTIAPVDQTHWLWWDELVQIVGSGTLERDRLQRLFEALDQIVPEGNWRDPLPDRADGQAVAHFLFQRMVDLPLELRELVLSELRERMEAQPLDHPSASASEEDRLYINWDEVRTLAREGVHIGGLTVHHPKLSLESTDVASAEIAESRRVLEGQIGQPVTCFAMPGGFSDHRTGELLAQAGYQLAVTVEKGANYPDTNRYSLRRICLSWDQAHHLAFKLAFADWLFGSRR